ncbi:aldehyde dehydrogenase family protein [Pelomonas sp. KK5]|uniref:aldehyde dehydrogenase family protein n=1 Tax=Pelomonas sp. KK5 TaxID=1855730 RepID=UPI00097BE826|nr:aldehyde dehydrogenase family protein [Pelomonas sp. KK5]
MDLFSDYTMTIGGKARTTAATLDVINPATGRPFATVPKAGAAEVDEAVTAAQAAFAGWRQRTIEDRRALLIQAADAIKANAAGLAKLFVMEQGRAFEAARGEVLFGATWLKAVARQELPVEIAEDTPSRRVELHREPLGVVAAIVPWNFPFLLAIWKIAPALLAGNTMVLKPSPFTPLCALKLAELWREILPPGVFNVVCGGDELGPLLTAHPGFAKISFTGSTATGKRVMAAAAGRLTRLTLELGGNDVAIVMPDVDVDAVAKELFHGAFYNSAQVCIATKRMYIHEAVYEPLRDRLHALARAAVVGDGLQPGTNYGPVQNKPLYERLLALIEEAHSQDLTLLSGSPAPEGGGYFVPLTLVDNPPEDARVVVEEAFGPVLPLLRFSDVDEVIRRANDSPYGLAGAVWSRDIEQAVAIARRLDTGNVWINQNLQNSPGIPFAGRKESGFGVENGEEGLKSFTQLKAIFIPKV